MSHSIVKPRLMTWKPLVTLGGLFLLGFIVCGAYIYTAGRFCPIEHASPSPAASSPLAHLTPGYAQNEHRQLGRVGESHQGWLEEFFCEAKAADIALVFFTWCLVVVTGWLAWATLMLWRAGESQLDIAANAAVAAKESAKAAEAQATIAQRALTDLERPWVFVHLAPKLRSRSSHFRTTPPDETDSFINEGLGIKDPPLAVFDIANHGRMPAIIVGCWAELGSVPIQWDSEQQVIIPPGMLRDEFQGAIGPNERRANLFLDCPAGIEYGVVVDLITEQVDPVPTVDQNESFVFSIRIEYLDVAGSRHHSASCWRFDMGVNYWVQYGGPKYNYQT